MVTKSVNVRVFITSISKRRTQIIDYKWREIEKLLHISITW